MFYNFSLKNQLSDKEKLGGKLDEDEQSKIEEVINEKIKWLEENTVSTWLYICWTVFLKLLFNQDASAEDLKAQKKEMEDIVQPIIAKLYQGQGGAPPPGGEEEEEDYDKDELWAVISTRNIVHILHSAPLSTLRVRNNYYLLIPTIGYFYVCRSMRWSSNVKDPFRQVAFYLNQILGMGGCHVL